MSPALVLLAPLKVSAEVAVILNRQSSRLRCPSVLKFVVEQMFLYLRKKYAMAKKNPSIPPLSSIYLWWDCGDTIGWGNFRYPFLGQCYPSTPGGSQGILRTYGRFNPSSGYLVCHRVREEYSWDVWTTSAGSSLHEGTAALLRAPQPTPRQSPATLQRDLLSAACNHYLILKLMAIGVGWNIDGLISWKWS